MHTCVLNLRRSTRRSVGNFYVNLKLASLAANLLAAADVLALVARHQQVLLTAVQADQKRSDDDDD